MNFDEARRLLSEDPLQNVGLLEYIRSDRAQVCAAEGKSVLAASGDYSFVMISAQDEVAAGKLAQTCPAKPETVFLTNAAYAPLIRQALSLPESHPYLQYVYPGDRPPAVEAQGFSIAPLTPEHAGQVFAQYTNPGGCDLGYIQSRIQEGPALGAFVEDVLAGFILTHEEGSMGILEVMPAWRGRGIAPALEASLAARLLELGRRPYGQVAIGNCASIRVQEKVGLVLCPKKVAWIF